MLEEFLNQLAATSWIEWLGMATGILGVWLSIKEKVAAWLFFIICYTIYVFIGYRVGLQAFMGMNVIFIGISIYGWRKWATTKRADNPALKPVRTSPRHWPAVGLFIVIGTGLVGLLLNQLDGAKLPYLDAFATCSALTAQWMLSRKQIETWIFWIITDIIYLCLFFQDQHWPSVILFTVFIGLAIKGWKDWQNNVSQ